MSSVIRSIELSADVDVVWAVVRDFSHPDRLAPGFVVEATRDGDERVVTFAGGGTVREVLVASDETERRLSYAATQGRSSHHNASMQVLPAGPGARLVWVTDVLPDDLADYISENMDRGLEAIQAGFAS